MQVPVVVVASVMMTLVAQSASGQVVAGIVVDGRDGQPLLDASVVLLDSRGEIKRGWLTDVDGVYQLMAPEPGRYTIRAGGPGLETWDSPPIQLDTGQELLMEIRLVPEGFYSGLAEFERRRDAYEGTFLTEDDIREKGGERFTDALRYVPGVSVVPLDRSQVGASESGMDAAIIARNRSLSDANRVSSSSDFASSFTVRIAGGHSGSEAAGVRQQLEGVSTCAPVLHVDGRWWGPIDAVGATGPDYELPPATIEAIEIYTRSQVPSELDTGRDADCGVIVVWRKESARSQ